VLGFSTPRFDEVDDDAGKHRIAGLAAIAATIALRRRG